jgi:3-methyladenine DNA glycosylase AlkD
MQRRETGPRIALAEVVGRLEALADPRVRASMARFGIQEDGRALGIKVPELRRLARGIGTDHALALELWGAGVHEARLLAPMVADPARTDPALADAWVADLGSWDVCDLLCLDLLCRVPFAHQRALEWSRRDEEFVRRAGFALMAVLAVRDRAAPDRDFAPFLEAVEREAADDRNFVKKAVSWALRQVGKRNPRLNRRALAVARRLRRSDARSARWVGSDAERELASAAVQRRLADRAAAPARASRTKRTRRTNRRRR